MGPARGVMPPLAPSLSGRQGEKERRELMRKQRKSTCNGTVIALGILALLGLIVVRTTGKGSEAWHE